MTEARDPQHRALVAELLVFLAKGQHRFAVGTSTTDGKRPDVASINTYGQVVIWEIKTRWRSQELEQAWNKYRLSCHMLYMVYPLGTDLTAWLTPSYLPTHPSKDAAGALLLGAPNWFLPQPPKPLRPDPVALCHLMQSVLRLHGSRPQNTSAAAPS